MVSPSFLHLHGNPAWPMEERVKPCGVFGVCSIGSHLEVDSPPASADCYSSCDPPRPLEPRWPPELSPDILLDDGPLIPPDDPPRELVDPPLVLPMFGLPVL